MGILKRGDITAEKITFIISLVIRITIFLAVISSFINGRWMIFFVSILAFALTFFPAMIERNYKISLPAEFEVLIVLFLYASLFLGEVHGYYTRFWWWDVVLHAGSGVALGIVGFLILYVMLEEKKLSAKPITIAFFSFTFALALGALWEIFEFGMDQIFGLNMQKSGLNDTMWDLIVDSIGALLVSVLGFIYLKGGKTRIFEGLINKFICENPKIFSKEKCTDSSKIKQ